MHSKIQEMMQWLLNYNPFEISILPSTSVNISTTITAIMLIDQNFRQNRERSFCCCDAQLFREAQDTAQDGVIVAKVPSY